MFFSLENFSLKKIWLVPTLTMMAFFFSLSDTALAQSCGSDVVDSNVTKKGVCMESSQSCANGERSEFNSSCESGQKCCWKFDINLTNPNTYETPPFCDSKTARGLVPCGRICDDPTTEANETIPCTLCHLLIGVQKLVNFGLKLAITAAFVAIVFAGVIYMISSGSESLMGIARKFLMAALTGFAFVFIAWLTVNVFLWIVSTKDAMGVKQGANWWTFTCDTTSSAKLGNLGDGTGSGSGGGGDKTQTLQVEPKEVVFDQPDQTQQLKVTYNGSSSATSLLDAISQIAGAESQDVTKESSFTVENPDLIEVAPGGLVKNKAQADSENVIRETKIKVVYKNESAEVNVKIGSMVCGVSFETNNNSIDLYDSLNSLLRLKNVYAEEEIIKSNMPKSKKIQEISERNGFLMELCINSKALRDKYGNSDSVIETIKEYGTIAILDPVTQKKYVGSKEYFHIREESGSIVANFKYDASMVPGKYDVLLISSKTGLEMAKKEKSFELTGCELIFGEANDPYTVVFARTNNITNKSGGNTPCFDRATGKVGKKNWDPNNQSELDLYKKTVKDAVSRGMNVIETLNQKFSVYRADDIIPDDTYRATAICPQIGSSPNRVYISVGWVENGEGELLYAFSDGGNAYYCIDKLSLGSERAGAFAHEHLGHSFGDLGDEYTGTAQYCKDLKGTNSYNCTKSSSCSKWSSLSQGGCYKGCLSPAFYRSSENSVMKDCFSSTNFSSLQLKILEIIDKNYTNRLANLKFLEEKIECQ